MMRIFTATARSMRIEAVSRAFDITIVFNEYLPSCRHGQSAEGDPNGNGAGGDGARVLLQLPEGPGYDYVDLAGGVASGTGNEGGLGGGVDIGGFLMQAW